MNAAITVQTVPFRRRFNLKKANWEQYAYQLDAAVENIPATAECYDQFVNALRKVARKNIPHGCRRNYVPGLTPESIELIKEYREKYEDDPFADSTITLVEELMSAISEERRKAWQTLIESTYMTHNSKKAWSTIRKLCDDPCKPKEDCSTIANQVARQLLLNGRVIRTESRYFGMAENLSLGDENLRHLTINSRYKKACTYLVIKGENSW